MNREIAKEMLKDVGKFFLWVIGISICMAIVIFISINYTAQILFFWIVGILATIIGVGCWYEEAAKRVKDKLKRKSYDKEN